VQFIIITWTVWQEVHSSLLNEVYRSCFFFLLVSWKSSKSCLPSYSTGTCIFPQIKCFKRQIPRQIWPIQLAFLLFIVCRIFVSTWICAILHFSCNPFISLQHLTLNPSGYTWLHSEVSNVQHHTTLCSKCNISFSCKHEHIQILSQ